MNIIVSGSLAYDRIMDFPDKFSNHILPDKIHILNVCFTINGLKENFGGTAGNIAYALSLLGERPLIVATAGRDFGSYEKWLKKNNIPTEHINIIQDELTAGAYITTDQSDNQITAFNPGAMKHSAKFDFDSLDADGSIAIIAPGNLDDMLNFSRKYKAKGIKYIFDPGQSLPGWDSEKLTEMIEGSLVFISNDYELEMTIEKTGLEADEIAQMTGWLITTRAEFGSLIRYMDNGDLKNIRIPAVKPRQVNDPTGAGDAYRAGLIKGLLLPAVDMAHAARIGSLSASYSVEVYGTQNFSFTTDEFNLAFRKAFGKKAF